MTHRPEPITPNGEIRIWQARTAAHIDAARSLFRDFVAWHRATHAEDLALIERYFDEAAFEDELGGLPGAYEPPAGSLLVAMAGERPAGCVALRDLGGGDCEMKRMFVPEKYRGQKIGWQLAEKVIADAQSAGYRMMRLDTSRRQVAAIALYERLGFRRVAAYYDLPAELADWLLFFERDL
jgi:ribosomal protein S18 acetylase RimI-like enzyme